MLSEEDFFLPFFFIFLSVVVFGAGALIVALLLVMTTAFVDDADDAEIPIMFILLQFIDDDAILLYVFLCVLRQVCVIASGIDLQSWLIGNSMEQMKETTTVRMKCI